MSGQLKEASNDDEDTQVATKALSDTSRRRRSVRIPEKPCRVQYEQDEEDEVDDDDDDDEDKVNYDEEEMDSSDCDSDQDLVYNDSDSDWFQYWIEQSYFLTCLLLFVRWYLVFNVCKLFQMWYRTLLLFSLFLSSISSVEKFTYIGSVEKLL